MYTASVACPGNSAPAYDRIHFSNDSPAIYKRRLTPEPDAAVVTSPATHACPIFKNHGTQIKAERS